MLKIRPATPEDATVTATINILGWKTAYRGLVPDEILDGLSLTEQRLQRFTKNILTNDIYLVAENETDIIGYLSGGKTRDEKLPYSYEVYTLYVHPDHQHLGVGRALMQAFKEKINFQDFCLYMLDGNERALKFYQKMGCVRYPEFDCDQESVKKLKIHELCLAFKGEK